MDFIKAKMDWSGRERNKMFISLHGGFEDMSYLSGLDNAQDSRSFVYPDLDHDGAPDIVLINRNAPILRIYRNGITTGNWLGVQLIGDGLRSNTDAVGALVTVRCGANTITRYLDRGTGFGVQNSSAFTIGLGTCSNVDSLSIRWPDGSVEVSEKLQARQYYVIRQGGQPALVENYYRTDSTNFVAK